MRRRGIDPDAPPDESAGANGRAIAAQRCVCRPHSPCLSCQLRVRHAGHAVFALHDACVPNASIVDVCTHSKTAIPCRTSRGRGRGRSKSRGRGRIIGRAPSGGSMGVKRERSVDWVVSDDEVCRLQQHAGTPGHRRSSYLNCQGCCQRDMCHMHERLLALAQGLGPDVHRAGDKRPWQWRGVHCQCSLWRRFQLACAPP